MSKTSGPRAFGVQNPTPTPSTPESEEVVFLPGSYEQPSTSNRMVPDVIVGRAFSDIMAKASDIVEGVKEKTDKASVALDKLSEIMGIVEIDQIKQILDGANKISSLGGTFADVIIEVLDTVKNPTLWLKYMLPLVMGVGAYLIFREKNGVLIPLMKGLCIAASAYLVIPEAQKLVEWLTSLRSFEFHSPTIFESSFGTKEQFLFSEDAFFAPVFNTVIHYAYGIDITFKQVIHLLTTIPKALDGASRIWGLVSGLWFEIKLRIYAQFGWPVKSGEMGIDRLVDSASDLILQLRTDKLVFTNSVAMRIDDMIKAHTGMITKLSNENKGSMLGYVKTSLEALKKAQIEIITRIGTGFGTRVEPVCIVLYGAPGNGKTIFSRELEKALIKDISTPVEWSAYCESERNAVFTVPPGLKHWETVTNSTKIIRIDELWAEKEVSGMEASQSLLLQQLINTAPFTPSMAFERKGTVSLEPSYVICTTNVTSVNGIATLEVPVAIKRRLHFLVEVQRGSKPFEDIIDLSNLRLHLSEVTENGTFKLVGSSLSAPELVAAVRKAKLRNDLQQRASHANADVQADYLLGLTADPSVYLQKLQAMTEFKQDNKPEEPMAYGDKEEILREIIKIDPSFSLSDPHEAAWEAFNNIPQKYNQSSFSLRGLRIGKIDMYRYFFTFCKITGISWSFKKFLGIFDDPTYCSCLQLPIAAFQMWTTTYQSDLLAKRTQVGDLWKKLGVILMDLPKMISNWIDKIIPSFVRRTDVLITVGGILLTAWYFSDEIKKMFYSDDFYPQSDEKFMRKGLKQVSRDKRYMFRMAQQIGPDPDVDMGGVHEYRAQMGDRVPELVKATHSAYVDNLYTIKQDLIVDRVGFALFIKEDLVLMPCHFAQLFNKIVDDIPDQKHFVIFKNSKGEFRVPIDQLLTNGFGDLSREFFVSKVDLGRQHRDITVHFANSTELNKFQVDFRNHMDIAIDLDDQTYVGMKSTWHHTAELNFVAFGEEKRKINSVVRVDNLKFKAGDCGIPYIAMSGPAAGKIVGIHVGGNQLYQQGLGIFLTKQIILAWFKNIHPGKIIKFNEPRRVILEDVLPVDRVSFTNAHCQFFGNEPIVDYLKTNVNITRKGIEERLLNYDRVLPVSYDMKHIEDVTMLIGAKFLANMPRGARRLGLHETLFGVPGEISSIDMSTSAGFPLQASDLDKNKWLLPDGTMNFEVLGRLRTYVEEDIKSYSCCIFPNHIFKIFPKDEKLPIFDVTEKNKVRTINGAPILHIIEQKMFFGDFTYLAELNSLELNHLIGVNLNSMTGDDLARRLLQVDPTGKHCFGGDISKFEFNQKKDIQMAIFDNIVGPCLSGLTHHELAISRMIWDHSASSVHKWDDKIYMVNGSRASGEYNTSLGNSLYVMVAIVYSYYKAVGFNPALLRTFYDNVYVVCMGDDNCGTVTEEASSFFNQFAIRDGLKDLGLKYTSPDKDDITEPFLEFDSLVMLQCTPRYDAILGRYVWAQNLHAILEIAQWTIKAHRKPDLNVWKSNVLESLKKLCVHDEVLWAKYVPLFQRMILGFDIDIPTWSYRQMQAIVFGEDDLRFRFRGDYMPSPAIVFNSQSGRIKTVSTEPLFPDDLNHPGIVSFRLQVNGLYANITPLRIALAHRDCCGIQIEYRGKFHQVADKETFLEDFKLYSNFAALHRRPQFVKDIFTGNDVPVVSSSVSQSGQFCKDIVFRLTPWGTYVMLTDPIWAKANISVADVVIICGYQWVVIPVDQTYDFWHDYETRNTPGNISGRPPWVHKLLYGLPKI